MPLKPGIQRVFKTELCVKEEVGRDFHTTTKGRGKGSNDSEDVQALSIFGQSDADEILAGARWELTITGEASPHRSGR